MFLHVCPRYCNVYIHLQGYKLQVCHAYICAKEFLCMYYCQDFPKLITVQITPLHVTKSYLSCECPCHKTISEELTLGIKEFFLHIYLIILVCKNAT